MPENKRMREDAMLRMNRLESKIGHLRESDGVGLSKAELEHRLRIVENAVGIREKVAEHGK